MADTIEDRIQAIIEEKRALFDEVIDGLDTASLGRFDLETLLRAVAP
jgi:SNF2 family DNA or RNA helicase